MVYTYNPREQGFLKIQSTAKQIKIWKVSKEAILASILTKQF